MGNFFKDWIWDKFPNYTKKSDSFKDGIGEGLLQRYLRVFGMELDEEFMPFLDQFLTLIDTKKVDSKYLLFLGSVVGFPPNFLNDPDIYRKVLAYAITIYKLKGTLQSFEILFNLLELEISITEEIPGRKETYDLVGEQYDKGRKYDQGCKHCSKFWISYNSIHDTCSPVVTNPVDPEILEAAQSIVCYLAPINAKFAGFTKRIKVCDDWNMNATDAVSFCARVTSLTGSYNPATGVTSVSWPDTGTFELRYRQVSPTVLAWSTPTVETSPWAHTFPSGTINQVQVRRHCGGTDYSEWMGVYITDGQMVLNLTQGETFNIQGLKLSTPMVGVGGTWLLEPSILAPGQYGIPTEEIGGGIIPPDTYSIRLLFNPSNPVPSTITSVRIYTEFTPLIGVEGTWIGDRIVNWGSIQIGTYMVIIIK